MKKKLNETNLKRKHARESKLMGELQKRHGYVMQEVPQRMPKTQMMFDRNMSVVNPMSVIMLLVPTDSALGEAIKKHRGAKAAAKEKR